MRTSYVFLALAVGALAACASPKTAMTAKNDSLPKQEVADATKPAVDECGAHALQSFVGKMRSDIPATPEIAKARIACTACAVTMDYRPNRLNIFFDEKSQVIEQIKCG
jgi:hypothetical protein